MISFESKTKRPPSSTNFPHYSSYKKNDSTRAWKLEDFGNDLSRLGRKNFMKLRITGQLPLGPINRSFKNEKKCQECEAVMDWKTKGAIQKGRRPKWAPEDGEGWYTYQGHCNGECQKEQICMCPNFSHIAFILFLIIYRILTNSF